jgi:hypothetical protein
VAGLASAVIPVAVGVTLAFAWNAAGSHRPGEYALGSGLTPQVSMAVEQAAAQAWADMTPTAMVRDSIRSSTTVSRSASGFGRLRPDG